MSACVKRDRTAAPTDRATVSTAAPSCSVTIQDPGGGAVGAACAVAIETTENTDSAAASAAVARSATPRRLRSGVDLGSSAADDHRSPSAGRAS